MTTGTFSSLDKFVVEQRGEGRYALANHGGDQFTLYDTVSGQISGKNVGRHTGSLVITFTRRSTAVASMRARNERRAAFCAKFGIVDAGTR